jgi:ribosomal protein S18 acetylase RimI-like enzyme
VKNRNYTVRPGTLGDLDQIIELHTTTFDRQAHLATRLGEGFIRSLYRWYLTSPAAFTLVAVGAQGRLAGVLTVNNGPYDMLFRENALAVVAGFVRRPQTFFDPEILLRIRGFLSRSAGRRDGARSGPPRCELAYLGFLAVEPEYRGAGTGAALVREGTAKCAAFGWTTVFTTVHRDNVPVRFMYATLGFKEEAAAEGDGRVTVICTVERAGPGR